MTQSPQEIEELYTCYTRTAANIISYFQDEERNSMLNELRQIVKRYGRENARLKSAESIRDRLYSLYDDDTQNGTSDIITEYKKTISEISVNTSDDTKLLEYDKQVEALLENVVTNGLQSTSDGADDELQLTGANVNVIDPISKVRMQDPVKNTKCGHTYDRQSVIQLLKKNKKTKCPVVGCRNDEYITLMDLQTDVVTKIYLERNPA